MPSSNIFQKVSEFINNTWEWLILLFGPLVIISSLIFLDVSFCFVICFVIYSSIATCVYHDYSMQYEPTQT